MNIHDFRAKVDALVREAPADALPAAIGELARGQAELEARNRQPKPTANGRRPPREVDQHYTAIEVAELLAVKKSWVYAHADEFGAVRLSEGCVRFPVSMVNRIVKRSTTWG